MRPRQIGQSLRLCFEPPVDLVLRRDVLVDIARFVPEIQHHAVADRLVVLIGVDVWPEGLDAPALVVFEQRRTREADHHGARKQRLRCLVQLAGLGAVAFVYEDEDIALGVEIRRQMASNIFDECVYIAFIRCAELVNQRADQPLVPDIEHVNQVGAAFRTVDVLADSSKDFLDLLVELGAVGDDQYP